MNAKKAKNTASSKRSVSNRIAKPLKRNKGTNTNLVEGSIPGHNSNNVKHKKHHANKESFFATQKKVLNYLSDLPLGKNPFRKTLFFSSEKIYLFIALAASVSASSCGFKFIVDVNHSYPALLPSDFYSLGCVFFLSVIAVASINRVYHIGQKHLDEDQIAWVVLFCNEIKEQLPNLHYMSKRHLAIYVRRAYIYREANADKYRNYMFTSYL